MAVAGQGRRSSCSKFLRRFVDTSFSAMFSTRGWPPPSQAVAPSTPSAPPTCHAERPKPDQPTWTLFIGLRELSRDRELPSAREAKSVSLQTLVFSCFRFSRMQNQALVQRIKRGLPVVAAACCLVPLFASPVFPLIDFYAHMARYFALAHVGSESLISENYQAAWRPLPNIALDFLGVGIMRILPPLAGAKVMAALVVLAPFLGTLVLARSLHGRISTLNVALSGILAFSFILAWGFVSFLVGLGLALAAIGFWISMREQKQLQFAIGAVAAIALLFVHGLVFALWGLVLAAVEVALNRSRGRRGWRAQLLPLGRLSLLAIVPFVLFSQMRTVAAEGGVTTSFANLKGFVEAGTFWPRLAEELWTRTDAFLRVAESSWPYADRLFGLVLWGTLMMGIVSGALRIDRRLLPALVLVCLLIAAMPPNMFGVGHLSERVPLVLLALLAASVSTQTGYLGSKLVPSILVVLFPLHQTMVAVGWWQERSSYIAYINALSELEPGGLGASMLVGDASDRDVGRDCMPLRFLMLLQNRKSVETFANPTQQPLALAGPLLSAVAASKPVAGDNNTKSDETRLAELFAAGFDTVVVCSATPSPSPVFQMSTARLHSQHEKWSLYRANLRSR